MADTPHASVVGNSLVSFMPGISPAMRESVQLALLHAQRATDQDAANGLVTDKYAYYRNKLKFFGWDAQPPLERDERKTDRRILVDYALATINAAGEHYRNSTQWALSLLKNSNLARTHFEERSLASETFRLIPCKSTRPGYVDLVLYHQNLTREQLRSGFLYVERRSIQARAELVHFNVNLFDSQFKAKVLKSLVTVAEREIVALQETR